FLRGTVNVSASLTVLQSTGVSSPSLGELEQAARMRQTNAERMGHPLMSAVMLLQLRAWRPVVSLTRANTLIALRYSYSRTTVSLVNPAPLGMPTKPTRAIALPGSPGTATTSISSAVGRRNAVTVATPDAPWPLTGSTLSCSANLRIGRCAEAPGTS